MKTISAVLALFFLMTSPALSATIFDLTGNGGWAKTYDFNQDGIGLTVSTGRQSGSSATQSSYDWLYQSNSNGLGMYSNGNGKNKEIDGKNADELVQFAFNTAVQLVSITFGRVDSNDDFDFFFDTGTGLTEQANNIDIPNNGTYLFSGLWNGDLFGIGANGKHDNFTIKRIEVAVTAIPLPAALPLYGSGLALIGYLGWRKRRRAAV